MAKSLFVNRKLEAYIDACTLLKGEAALPARKKVQVVAKLSTTSGGVHS